MEEALDLSSDRILNDDDDIITPCIKSPFFLYMFISYLRTSLAVITILTLHSSINNLISHFHLLSLGLIVRVNETPFILQSLREIMKF